jgi:hypothetical protein
MNFFKKNKIKRNKTKQKKPCKDRKLMTFSPFLGAEGGR